MADFARVGRQKIRREQHLATGLHPGLFDTSTRRGKLLRRKNQPAVDSLQQLVAPDADETGGDAPGVLVQ